MTARVLLLGRQLGARSVDVGQVQERIVTKTVFAPRSLGEQAIEGAARCDEHPSAGVGQTHGTHESRGALGLGNRFDLSQQLLVVGLVALGARAFYAGVARRVHARRPPEGVHLEPAVVGQAMQAGRPRVANGFAFGVRLERVAILDRLRDGLGELVQTEDSNPDFGEDLLDLSQLVRVGRSEEDPIHGSSAGYTRCSGLGREVWSVGSTKRQEYGVKREDLRASDTFLHRHIGPRESDTTAMLESLGLDSLDAMIAKTVPASILSEATPALPPPRAEHELLADLRDIAGQNRIYRSYIGLGYSDCITPPVILRNVLENPGWYTQYTAYQAEISQGRLEALLNYQTMVCELTGLGLANASLLDEGTAAAEAMQMCMRIARDKRKGFFVVDDCHPQSLAVMKTRAKPSSIELFTGSTRGIDFDGQGLFGIMLSYPTTDGRIEDYAELIARAHEKNVLVVVATDLLALTLLRPPGELGADIAIGSTQRFGVPLGYGGPHAAFMATHEKYSRHTPGRIVGVSKDSAGRQAYRLALQTREQHIRRDRATSNICTAQVLLAIMAGCYAVYHGPEGLERIARRVHGLTSTLAAGLSELGLDRHGPEGGSSDYFDTLRVKPAADARKKILAAAEARRLNLRMYPDGSLGVSLDETTTLADVGVLLSVFAAGTGAKAPDHNALADSVEPSFGGPHRRESPHLEHPVFRKYHAEHELVRYLSKLQGRDLSLTTSMIPLGSCTMKLNGTTEMIPVTWPEFGNLHPFAPAAQTAGYSKLHADLENWLAALTGFAATSLQPNAGSQGEYAGLLVIRAHHESRGEGARDVCLIPTSAHGTNPASAVMAGFRVVPVKCDDHGNIDVDDLRAKAEKHTAELAALMVTYPSTHGVFEESIRDICNIVHDHGGQVYLDGANMNAQVGICRPGEYGADVCHLNLHKTFCIPHGGGGPGMGPICVAAHLAPLLPSHPLGPARATGESSDAAIGPVSAAPFGSPSILPIPWVYIALLGSEGLRRASEMAILNANYMAKRLEGGYDVLFRGNHGLVAHEFVLDCRSFKKSAGIEVEDIAKRLIDYGFHAPTMSWPVPGTLMVEPTESEPKAELDRFCDAMLSIREEIREIEEGRIDKTNNPMKRSPHTAEAIASDSWDRPYTREQAAYPAPWLREFKFWPSVGRIDNAYGDRHLVCSCPPMEEYASD